MSGEQRVIKKYPNRRLYDTSTSSYITLADVKQLVLEGVDIQVVDAKTADDITRSVLLQIILEEEAGGMPLFSYDMLTNIIRFYGNAMQGVMGTYLEKNLRLFAEMQGKLQEQTDSVLKGGNPMLNQNNFWSEMMKYQPQAMQDFMGQYLERSGSLFTGMQQQFEENTRAMLDSFGNLPGSPGAPNPKK